MGLIVIKHQVSNCIVMGSSNFDNMSSLDKISIIGRTLIVHRKYQCGCRHVAPLEHIILQVHKSVLLFLNTVYLKDKQ